MAEPEPSEAGRMGMVKRFRALLLAAVAAAGAALVFGFGLPLDETNENRWFLRAAYVAFFVRTFSFHIGVALLLAAGLAILCRARRLSAVALGLGIAAAGPGLASQLARGAQGLSGEPITVMSCNLYMGHTRFEALLREIDEADPDVILFQEFTPLEADRVRGALGERYKHRTEMMRSDAFGQAIYSRLPFAAEPVVKPQREFAPWGERDERDTGFVGLSDPQIRAVVTLGSGRQVVVQNVHLPPPVRPSYFAEQRLAYRWLADFASREQRPVIIAGDFNATPNAAATALLRRAGLREAHGEAGRGRGSTWPDETWLRHWPGVRIDQAWLANGLRADEVRVGGRIGSDHRSIVIRAVLEGGR